MNEPQWTKDGMAHNIEAALADALLWLHIFANLLVKQPSIDMIHHTDNIKRLRMCIKHASLFLPDSVVTQKPDSII